MGPLWVERYTFPDETGMPDVFSPVGGYLGTLAGAPPTGLGLPTRSMSLPTMIEDGLDRDRLFPSDHEPEERNPHDPSRLGQGLDRLIGLAPGAVRGQGPTTRVRNSGGLADAAIPSRV